MREYIGQQLIIGIEGTQLTQDEAKFITDNNIGGVILFSRNFESLEQLHQLVTDLQRLRYQLPDQTPLFISIDMEGGRVQRLKDPFTIWPPQARFGAIDSSSLCFTFTHFLGQELKALGINMNFAPCVDVLFNPKNQVIGDRALSADPEVVARLASALVRGFIKAEVIPVAKHFPGHGYTVVDSHDDLPIDDRTLRVIEENGDLEPFKRVIKSRCDALMTAHIKYPKLDPQFPASLSPLFINQILRGALRYKGLVITDDLDMKALTKHYPIDEIPLMAINAGANVLLYCNRPSSPRTAVNAIARGLSDKQIAKADVENNYKMIIDLKKKKLKQPIEPYSLDKVKSLVGNAEHKKFAQDVVAGNVEEYLNKKPS